MKLIAASIRRDWRLANTHRLPFAIEVVAVLSSALLFSLLGRYVGSTRDGVAFFTFAIAGLALVRQHAGVPRILQRVSGDRGAGSLEELLSSPSRTSTVLLGEAAFETLRGLALATGFIAVAIGMFGADVHLDPASLVSVVVGLCGAAALFASLAIGTVGVLMVVREAAALGSLLTVALPVLAGAYFPVEELPQPLEGVAEALPFRLPVEVIRHALLEGGVAWEKALMLALGAGVSLALSLAVAHAGVEHARRAGTLALE